MASMFELLMELPLFQGVSHDSMAAIVGAAKFHFMKFPQDETILRAGDPCSHITFVISGKVRSTVVNTAGSFAVSQTLTAPAVLAPDFLFGRVTTYPATVVALEPVSILQISKLDYINILYSDKVFLFNYLNLLSVNAQKAQVGILSLTKGDVDERIAFWITALTQKGGSDITLTCRSRDLCSLFNTPRSIFIAALDDMKQRGLLDYTNTELSIHSRESMLNLLLHTPE
ncbi:MAG: Crp/Fnr family transcriptional regulator [Muribaculaceae bacterium]|nr:Crp/Fnr family transcriptional regulator [Muribaculaceae bacterium]